MLKIDWQSVDSMSISDLPEHLALEAWCNTLSKERGRDLRLLEVGSYHGRTSALLCQFGQLIAIDLFGDIGDGMSRPEYIGVGHFNEFIETIKRLNLIDRIFPIVGTSSYLEFFPDLYLDLAFVDASHYYQNVKKDLRNVQRHIAQGGIIAVHDYKRPGWGYSPEPGEVKRSDNDPWSGVAKAVDEFLESEEWKLFNKVRGIGFLARKGEVR